jgi:hypothetical protein
MALGASRSTEMKAYLAVTRSSWRKKPPPFVGPVPSPIGCGSLRIEKFLPAVLGLQIQDILRAHTSHTTWRSSGVLGYPPLKYCLSSAVWPEDQRVALHGIGPTLLANHLRHTINSHGGSTASNPKRSKSHTTCSTVALFVLSIPSEDPRPPL